MIKYSVKKSYNGDYYVIWKEIVNQNSFACTSVFKGTKTACYKELKKYKNV